MYMLLFFLENDEDQKPILNDETKRVEKLKEKSVTFDDLADMDRDEVFGDENESGKFPFIFWPILITNP